MPELVINFDIYIHRMDFKLNFFNSAKGSAIQLTKLNEF